MIYRVIVKCVVEYQVDEEQVSFAEAAAKVRGLIKDHPRVNSKREDEGMMAIESVETA